MPFSKGHVGLCSSPAIRELTELAQPGWRNSQGVEQVASPWQELESRDRELLHSVRAIPEIRTEGFGLFLLPALLPQLLSGWNKVSIRWCVSLKGKFCAWTLSKLAFVSEVTLQKRTALKQFGYLLGNKGKVYLNGDQETAFVTFVLIYVKLLSFDPHMQCDTLLQDTLMDLWSWICSWRSGWNPI